MFAYNPLKYVARANKTNPKATNQKANSPTNGMSTNWDKIPKRPMMTAMDHVVFLGGFSFIFSSLFINNMEHRKKDRVTFKIFYPEYFTGDIDWAGRSTDLQN